MSIQTLYQAGAFGPGADVWVIPEPRQSSWTYKIDWYLNFQLSRAKFHKSKELSNDLLQTLQECEIEAPKVKNMERKPLLIASGRRFPNKQVIEVPKSKSPEEWLKTVHSIWVDLGRPSLRVFLPKDFKESAFKKEWPEKADTHPITLVPNQ